MSQSSLALHLPPLNDNCLQAISEEQRGAGTGRKSRETGKREAWEGTGKVRTIGGGGMARDRRVSRGSSVLRHWPASGKINMRRLI
ncbi:hypothetical protein E2C01_002175 [Portunus trituberculatus]|uniref:Uncharacterized protein n=1 Tax=Portunus trituberculatus TaxID=210409 RepID=A0A5B7CJ70_PORTR|nr:hypothetical protein [Portunus trituberculatus]